MHNPTYRVVQILNLFIQNEEQLSFGKIAILTQIPKGTLSPILSELVCCKYLGYEKATGFYHLGIEVFKLGAQFLNKNNTLVFIKKYMEEIVELCDETCQFGVLEGANVLYLQKVEPKNPIRLFSFVGKQLPAYATAIGKALLSDKSNEELDKIYSKNLKIFTKNTLKTLKDLKKQITIIQNTGIATEDSEHTEGIRCISMPIKNYKQKIIAALSISFPSFRVDDIKYEFMIKILQEQVSKIQKELDFFDEFPYA